MKLAVNIDPILLSARLSSASPALFTAAHELSQTGVAMLDAAQIGEWDSDTKRDWKLVRDHVTTSLSLRTVPVRESVERALQLHPERITFVQFSSKNQSLTLSPSDRSFDWNEVIKIVRDHGVDPFLRIEPDLDSVKRAAKMHFAGLEFDSTLLASYKGAALIEAVSKWNEFAVASWKLGLGVWATASVRADVLSSLHSIREIEGIILQEDFWARSMLQGIERTIAGIRYAMA